MAKGFRTKAATGGRRKATRDERTLLGQCGEAPEAGRRIRQIILQDWGVFLRAACSSGFGPIPCGTNPSLFSSADVHGSHLQFVKWDKRGFLRCKEARLTIARVSTRCQITQQVPETRGWGQPVRRGKWSRAPQTGRGRTFPIPCSPVCYSHENANILLPSICSVIASLA